MDLLAVLQDASNHFVHSKDGWVLFGTAMIEPPGVELKRARPDGIKPGLGLVSFTGGVLRHANLGQGT